MARPRKQTYTLEMYLKKINDGDIDNNADVQRNMVWSNEQVNELIVTVLTDEYIPPIILGEKENSQLQIVDGGCRSAALNSFWMGIHKITSSIENSIIFYKKKMKQVDGSIEWEEAVFDIKNKTINQLPEELQKKFNEYQIETVIHENCDKNKISKFIKRYNNHTSMNTDQKAFTYINKFAGNIRKILKHKFFLDYSSYTENEKNKGATERIVVDTIMCMNHFEHWKTQAKAACKYLNDNALEEEFDTLAANLRRLEGVITNDIKGVFNKKDSFIFLTLFDKFIKLGMEDTKFAEFLRAFQEDYRFGRKNDKGLLFDEIDRELSTKDKQVIVEKLNLLENVMLEFLHIKKEDTNNTEEFIAKNIALDVEMVHEDMDLYNSSLDTLLENTVKIESKLREEQNRLSLLAMMAYSYKEDIDLDEWLTQFAFENHVYFTDQQKNFLHMKAEFERFLEKEKRKNM